ncbi:TIGR02270 family protein [Geomesophilobacter sediminis]|uniref:TIGR02270 family protein n=1 Tax=Geomesophilobacter sediminis TaxID=2798584 RepID=A0A8J7M1J9_9BACT|nr:TIGR02270 family protein [Geomesophilobacter sediminis]MBJ6726998.1 TIGR02270 family protein [Geomesophilobacter sediminis]
MNSPATSDRVAITAMGLVTSLGLDAASSLAAIRSGLANFSEHETVLVECDQYGTELCGATIARLPHNICPRDLQGADRSIALLSRAITECTEGIPNHLRQRALWLVSAGSSPDPRAPVPLLLAAHPEISVHIPQKKNEPDSQLGRCLFFEDLIQAAEALQKRAVELAFIGCVDSLCGTEILELLLEEDRLKSRMDNPEGIVAGEAAGVFALELASSAARRGAAPLGFIDSWGGGIEPCPWNSSKSEFSAVGLSEALNKTVPPIDSNGGRQLIHVVADLNGNGKRSQEWALAASRVFVGKAETELLHPADCTGDCGMAMGAVLLATALDLLSETPSPTRVVVYCSDEGSARRALSLQRGHGCQETSTDAKKGKGAVTVPAVISQHGEEVVFLWNSRSEIVTAPDRSLADLSRHDRRLAANLAGLTLAKESGGDGWEHWPAFPEASDYFAVAYPAFKTADQESIEALLEKAAEDAGFLKAIASALGWLPFTKAKPHIDFLFRSDSPLHRYITVSACAFHRHDPGHLLNHAAYDACPLLVARTMRSMGELGRRGRLNLVHLSHSYQADDHEVRFWAAWAGVMAGDPDAMSVLTKFITPESEFRHRALALALRHMEQSKAHRWWDVLARYQSTRRLAADAAGIIGDPMLVPWLLEQMAAPTYARGAGAAFSLITGVDLANLKLDTAPAKPCGSPSETAGDASEPTQAPDRGLPWPDGKKVAAWWNENRKNFRPGVRHRLGQPLSKLHLQQVLKNGNQSARTAAALDLALMNPGQPLFDVEAPAGRQVALLS